MCPSCNQGLACASPTFSQGGGAMLDFSFSELYAFVLALLAIILPYVAKRKDDDDNDKTAK